MLLFVLVSRRLTVGKQNERETENNNNYNYKASPPAALCVMIMSLHWPETRIRMEL